MGGFLDSLPPPQKLIRLGWVMGIMGDSAGNFWIFLPKNCPQKVKGGGYGEYGGIARFYPSQNQKSPPKDV